MKRGSDLLGSRCCVRIKGRICVLDLFNALSHYVNPLHMNAKDTVFAIR